MRKGHNHIRIVICLLLASLLGAATGLFGQEVRTRVKVDSTQFLIGDHINFHIEVEHEAQVDVLYPLLAGKLGDLEIFERSEVDTTRDRGVTRLSQDLILMAFDSGYYRIPPVAISYRYKGDTTLREELTNPINIEVFTIPIDTTQEEKPIKSPLDDPYRFREALPYIVLGLLLLITAGVIVWYRKFYKNLEPVQIREVAPKVPPHVTAMGKLAQLEKEKYWQQGDIKTYFSEISFILREYLEGRYHILALESTTDEILTTLERRKKAQKQSSKLRDLLETADLAKFAKFKPDPTQCLRAMDEARTFVKTTSQKPKPQLEPQSNPETTEKKERN